MTVMRSAQVYFGIVFAAGFVLGTLRVFFLAPMTGELVAVLLEVPVILAISWWAAGVATRNRPHLATPSARLNIGAIAFLGLMVAEASLAIALGGTLAGFLEGLQTPAGLAGLAGQLLFALFPWLRLKLQSQ
ncbi:hypothetical protein [Aestuariivita boseongensis]|uniref:hypothetical protein n=1 Tax=Aestuariivita boseongensis TaxID=1470562 RepID=UPI0006833BC7|nr:hypothetical protein [Aestuariivita boseongensis]